MNWQYLVIQKDGREAPINDYESMMIGDQMKQIRVDPKTDKLAVLSCSDMVMNVYSSVITKNGKTKLLKKAFHNIRELRQRPEESQKADNLIL